MQSVDPTLLAIQTANTAAQDAKKKVLPSLSTQAIAKPSLNVQTQQSQAISTPPTAKVGGISSPFWAPNINSSPVLWWATTTEIETRAKQLQSLPKTMPETWSSMTIPKEEFKQKVIQAKQQWFTSTQILQRYKDKWYTIEWINYNDFLEPTQWWWQKDNFITNLWSWIAWTVSATGKLWKNLAFKAVDLYRTKVQGKEKLTPEQIANIEQSPMWQNLSSITNRQTEKQKESFWWKVGNVVWTLWQAFTMPTGIGSLSKIPVIAKAAAKAPLISSMIKWWLQWVVGQDQYTLMTEWRASTAEERKVAWWLGLLFPLAWAIIKEAKPFVQKWIKSAVNTLQTSWIINPAKFDQIKSQLIAEWVDWIEKATVDDVANFLTERGVKWTRQQQADILLEVADKSRLAKKEVLDLSTNLHAPDSAKTLAQTLVEELWNAKSQATKAIANKAQQLLNKLNSWWATLNEIDDLRAMWRKELNTRTSAGNVKISQQDVDNLIWEVRWYIEDAAQAEWLPQLVGYQWKKNLIKMLNNQTSTAKWLADWILRRDSTDAVQQLMTFMSARGWWVIAWGLAWSQWWVFDGNTTAGKIWNIAIWAFLWWVIDNPSIKSKTAQYLNKLTWTQKSNILKRMESWWKELLEREDKDVLNWLKNIIMGNNKEMPNSLPFKPNANITNNNITTSVMGNSNKAGVIPWPVNAPAPTPKTPPITVEKWAIGMWTPKPKSTTVLPPKPTVAPSVWEVKATSNGVISNENKKILTDYLEKHEKARNNYIKSVYETYDWDIAKSYIKERDNKYWPKATQARDILWIKRTKKSSSDVQAENFFKGLQKEQWKTPPAPKWFKWLWKETMEQDITKPLPKKTIPKLWKEIMEQDMDILKYNDEDTLFYRKNDNWWIRYHSSKQEVKDLILSYEKRWMSMEEISNKIQEKFWVVDKKMVLSEDIKDKISASKYISGKITIPRILYRWVWKWWPTGTAKFWEGIYSSPNYKNAKAYWDVKTLTSEAIPNSPLQFKNFGEYENWLHYDVAKALWVDGKRWVDKMYPDIWAIVKQMGYDWITLWPKDDMYVVKFTNKTWVWSLPPLPKKWK